MVVYVLMRGNWKVLLIDDLLGKGGSIMAAKEVYLDPYPPRANENRKLTPPPSKLCEKLGATVLESLFIFDCDGVPGYREIVQNNLGEMKRYAMISLTTTNIGNPVN
jgi:adenine phosphoribosyltransferase